VAWFDRKAQTSPLPAHFEDVTQEVRRHPSWLAKASSSPVPPASLPRPPRIPSEMCGTPVVLKEACNEQDASQVKREESPELSAPSSREVLKPSMSPAELESLVAEHAVRQSTEQAMAQSRSAITEALEGIAQAHQRIEKELSSRAAELATLIARRVIGRELRTQPDIVVDLVREGLEVLNAKDQVRVHLGPAFAVMQAALVAHFSATGVPIDAMIDNSLPAYGCVVETDVGSVDESIESRLAAILDAVECKESETCPD
jgi:flagellar assembly protein FliH